MKKKLTRKQELEVILVAITMPVLVLQIYQYNRWWLPYQFPQLRKKVEDELSLLDITVII